MAAELGKRVYVVRHGNTFDKGDIVRRVGGRTDLALSVSGREQADRLAAHFMANGIVFDKAYSSPLKRTMETARSILTAQGGNLPIEPATFLREIDYGPDENAPEEDVVRRIGEDALQKWETDAIPPPGWLVDNDGLTAAWASFLEQMAGTNARNILAVTSNGIARFLLNLPTLNNPDATLKLRTAAYGVIRIGDTGTPLLEDWNIRPPA
ncbi:MAG: histidine phosphatase family protein [Alphaproteobacteria bacterium]|nr:histidine phosphatase family protein [Alphaproteobacteria bacterium]